MNLGGTITYVTTVSEPNVTRLIEVSCTTMEVKTGRRSLMTSSAPAHVVMKAMANISM